MKKNIKLNMLTSIITLSTFSLAVHSEEAFNLDNYSYVKSSIISNISIGFKDKTAYSFSGRKENFFSPIQTNVIDAAISFGAIAYLKDDGSVIVKGSETFGGDTSRVQHLISEDVKSITADLHGFSALKNNGDVVWWRGARAANSPDNVEGIVANNIETIYAARDIYFAGIDSDGKVQAWGTADKVNPQIYFSDVEGNIQGQVSKIISTDMAFSVLSQPEGKVTSWGVSNQGGNQTIPVDISSNLQNDIVDIASTRKAFAAINKNGDVYTWGSNQCGATQERITNVTSLVGNKCAFAGIKKDGSVVAWGAINSGGEIPEAVATQLVDITSIYASPNRGNFAALSKLGKVTVWGENSQDFKAISSLVSHDVVSVSIDKNNQFTAIKKDGSRVIWGGDRFAEIGAN
ncbi:hypothetical protein PUN50_16685 [Vibrio campbellii]|uniref:Chromosome condensation regulator RCC1 n=1 Tax=Vibrio campbellii TaxID=680 RepID=A0AAQ3AYH8_9VIBR|nr:hypothetical protein [Vibrio campbellii]WDG08324.1 hypothetical protein PUN50_16685 [Vibrio campbellii]